MNHQNQYDVIVIGAGPGGIFTAYELSRLRPELRIAVFEAGNPLEKRKCPIDGVKVTSCMGCKTCAIMNGFGGAGAFSGRKIQYYQSVRRHPARVYRQEAGNRPDEVCR